MRDTGERRRIPQRHPSPPESLDDATSAVGELGLGCFELAALTQQFPRLASTGVLDIELDRRRVHNLTTHQLDDLGHQPGSLVEALCEGRTSDAAMAAQL